MLLPHISNVVIYFFMFYSLLIGGWGTSEVPGTLKRFELLSKFWFSWISWAARYSDLLDIIYHFRFVFIKCVIRGIVESFHCTVLWCLFKRDTDMRLARISFQADGRLLWFPAWMTQIEVITLQRYIQSTTTVLDCDLYLVIRQTRVNGFV